MKAYIVICGWRSVLEPDSRGVEEKIFLAYSDEHAYREGCETAKETRTELVEILKVTDGGNITIWNRQSGFITKEDAQIKKSPEVEPWGMLLVRTKLAGSQHWVEGFLYVVYHSR